MENFMAQFWLNILPYNTLIHKGRFKSFLVNWIPGPFSSAVYSQDGQLTAQENPQNFATWLNYSCPFSVARRAMVKDSGRYSSAISGEPSIYSYLKLFYSLALVKSLQPFVLNEPRAIKTFLNCPTHFPETNPISLTRSHTVWVGWN
uniref:Uncharacterized protein n=1 Tax=Micrurus lemniscatus lemniscatus TaxID=129467 RepID=A0A2D4JJ80_MICLE